MNGAQMERDLVHVLRDHGWAAMRSPGSGTGDWPMPDVLAAKGGYCLAVELKAGDPPANVRADEVDALRSFSAPFWAVPFIGARFAGDRTIFLTRPDDLGRTGNGRYSIPSDSVLLERAVALPYTKTDAGIQADDIFCQDPDRAASTLLQAVAADQYDITRDDATPVDIDREQDADADLDPDDR